MNKLFELIMRLFKPAPEPVPTPEPRKTAVELEAEHDAQWITEDEFRRATNLRPDLAKHWYRHIKPACVEYGIVTPQRIAAFLAQVGHESGGFRYTREIWGPTEAQKRYEGREDLGNTKAGDGSKYRGRGLVQITGRYNYEQVSKGLGVDFVARPEYLETDHYAALSAAWWWSKNGCNRLADLGDFTALTRRINGGTNGLADRQARHSLAQQALGI